MSTATLPRLRFAALPSISAWGDKEPDDSGADADAVRAPLNADDPAAELVLSSTTSSAVGNLNNVYGTAPTGSFTCPPADDACPPLSLAATAGKTCSVLSGSLDS